MTRPSFENLGFDPAPGDVHELSTAARSLRNTVLALTEVDGVLASDRDGEWVGKAAEAFRSMVGEELSPRVKDALGSFDAAARAVGDWVDELDDFQRRADALEVRAREARADLESAQGALDGLPKVDPDADDADDQKDARDAADRKVGTADAALQAVMRDARSLAEEVESAAGSTANRLDSSAASAPDEPGLLDRIGNALKDLGEMLWEGLEWLMDALDQILPYLLFALAVVSLFVPGLGPLIFALSVTAILIDTKQALTGEGSWGDVIMGVAALGIGAGLGKLADGFMMARGNAFSLRINSPGIALPGGGVVSNTATAVIRFNPTAYNIAGMGWAVTKFTDLKMAIPPALQPAGPGEDDR